jgi:hypothetical protein
MTHQPPAWNGETAHWPRLAHHPATRDETDGATHGATDGATRLDMAAMTGPGAVAEPTVALQQPLRTVPAPDVKPIPRPRIQPLPDAVKPSGRDTRALDGEDRLEPQDFVSRVLADQHELNLAHQAAMMPRLRKVMGWNPAKPPSLREEAEARVRTAQREAERKLAHERRMDRLAEARSIVGLVCLIAVFALIVGMGYVGFMIVTGHYAWAPVKVT